MLGVSDPWTLALLLSFAIGVTLVTNWIAGGFRRPLLNGSFVASGISSFIASLIWILLLLVAGIIAVRYIERINSPVTGWALVGLLAFAASLIRARLYRRIDDEQAAAWMREAVYNLVYLFSAAALYLLLSLVSHQPANPLLFVPLCIGALLPDLDSRGSLLGRLLPFVSKKLETRLGPCGGWHSLVANLSVAGITTPLIVLIGWQAWALTSLGFLVHLVIDSLRPRGLELFWPVGHARVHVLGLLSPGGLAEKAFCAFLAVTIAVLLFTVDIGKRSPPPVPVPSYEQTVERYYSMRGRNLVFAWVEGSWQATGRRMSGRFEVLNAVGESFVLLDRYDGTLFTAGRTPADHLYVSRISLSEGASIRVKPAEIHLKSQYVAEALPTVYQMQSEPGLQHIYVSGDVIVPESGGTISLILQADYAQGRLRKVQAHENGHFTLRYLTASELVALAGLEVKTADLVIMATYETPAAGPTVTPLPLPPFVPEGAQ